jgi:hypothetical protein
VNDIAAGAGAAFLGCAAAVLAFAAACALRRAFRRAARIDARPPVPGQPHPPGGAVGRTAPGNPVLRAAPAPGSRSYRAPGSEDLGTCYLTIHHHEKGAVVLNHVLRTRRVLPAESDDAFLARIERELGLP